MKLSNHSKWEVNAISAHDAAKGPYLGKQRRYVLIVKHIKMLRRRKILMPIMKICTKMCISILQRLKILRPSPRNGSQDLATLQDTADTHFLRRGIKILRRCKIFICSTIKTYLICSPRLSSPWPWICIWLILYLSTPWILWWCSTNP